MMRFLALVLINLTMPDTALIKFDQLCFENRFCQNMPCQPDSYITQFVIY